MPIVRLGHRSQKREFHEFRFGLIPSWEREAKGARYLNARVETVLRAKPFSGPLKKRRCLVVVDGFYEWKDAGTKTKQPYYVHFANDAPFALAGLWDRWRDATGTVLDSCAIITGPSLGPLEHVHDRMPLFLPPNRYEEWLADGTDPAPLLESLAATMPAWELRRVSNYVNSATHEGPECVEPTEAEEAG